MHGAWQVVHGILAFGPEFPLQHGDEVVPALDYLLGGGAVTGWRLRPGNPGVIAIVEEGSTTGQGHPDQWIGYLAQCGLDGVSIDTPISVNGDTRLRRWGTTGCGEKGGSAGGRHGPVFTRSPGLPPCTEVISHVKGGFQADTQAERWRWLTVFGGNAGPPHSTNSRRDPHEWERRVTSPPSHAC